MKWIDFFIPSHFFIFSFVSAINDVPEAFCHALEASTQSSVDQFEEHSLVFHGSGTNNAEYNDHSTIMELSPNHMIEGDSYEYMLLERIRFSSIYPQLSHSSAEQKALTKFKHSFDVTLSSTGSLNSLKLPKILSENEDLFVPALNSVANMPLEEFSFSKIRNEVNTLAEKYTLGKKLGRGNFGEVWFARGRVKSGLRLQKESLFEDFVLKRIFCERGELLFESGKREIHVGKKLSGKLHISRFIESFSINNELWLVFRNEGKSLDKVLYEEVDIGGDRIFYQPSSFWYSLRDRKVGLSIRVELLKQALKALETLARSGIVHRDLKPSNIFLQRDGKNLVLRLGDFGSAFDYETNIYENNIANYLQETERYAPPESRLFRERVFPYFDKETELLSLDKQNLRYSFDVWSLGVVYLEIFFGTERMFEIENEQTRKKIEKELLIRARKQGLEVTHELRKQAEFIQSLGEFGIHPYTMNKTQFALKVKQKDRFTEGLTSNEVNVVFEMLQWKPEERSSVSDLLSFPLFK